VTLTNFLLADVKFICWQLITLSSRGYTVATNNCHN